METWRRRLPLVNVPVRGESFTGWLTRYATRCHIPVGVLVDALGIPVRQSAIGARPVWADILVSDTAASAITETTGMPPSWLADTCLSRFDGTLLDFARLDQADETSLRTVAQDQWVLTGRSRACPDCLAGDGIWRTWWRLGLAGVCPDHHTVLADTCPACGHPLASGVRYPRASMPAPAWQCGHAMRRDRCNHDLRTLDRVPAPANAVRAQAALLAAAGSETCLLAGTAVDVTGYITAWRSVMNMLRGTTIPAGTRWPAPLEAAWAGEQQRLDAGDGGGRCRKAPASAALAAGLLDSTWPLMSAGTAAAAAAAAAPIAVHAASAGGRGQQRHWRTAENIPVIGTMLATARPRQARVAGVLAAAEVARLDSRHIPTTADRATYLDRFASLLPGTAERTGRLYAAMACARAAGEPSWARAADALDIPATRGARISDTITRRVTDAGALAGAVRATVNELADASVDYRARRAALAGLERIDVDTMRDVMPGRPITVSRTIHAAAWMWEHHTASPATWSPAHRAALAAGTRPDSLKEAYRVFTRTLTSGQEAQLAALASELGGHL